MVPVLKNLIQAIKSENKIWTSGMLIQLYLLASGNVGITYGVRHSSGSKVLISPDSQTAD